MPWSSLKKTSVGNHWKIAIHRCSRFQRRAVQTVVPGPSGWPLIGNIPQVIQAAKPSEGSPCRSGNFTNILKWVSDELHSKYGPIVSLQMGPQQMVYVADADAARYINEHHPGKFIKGESYTETLSDGYLDESLILTDDAEQWKAKRKLYNNAFSGRALRSYIGHFLDAADRMGEKWSAAPGQNQGVDFAADFAWLTLDVIGNAGFGTTNLADGQHEFAKAFHDHQTFMHWKQNNVLLQSMPSLKYLTPQFRRDQQSIRTLTKCSREIVRERRLAMKRGNDQHRDLLSFLIQASDEASIEHPETAGLTDDQLAREVNLFIFAGHDTTSATLAWAWAFIHTHSEIRARLLDELEQVRPLDGWDGSAEEQRKSHQALLQDAALPYMSGVIREALRLYGPVSGVYVRKNVSEEELCGYRFAPNTMFFLNLWAMHRDPKVWGEDAEEFKPERWSTQTPEMKKSFMAFAQGPRTCIGMNFAMMEMKSVLARLLPRWDSEIIVFPHYGLNLTFMPIDGRATIRSTA